MNRKKKKQIYIESWLKIKLSTCYLKKAIFPVYVLHKIPLKRPIKIYFKTVYFLTT